MAKESPNYFYNNYFYFYKIKGSERYPLLTSERLKSFKKILILQTIDSCFFRHVLLKFTVVIM